MRFIRTGVVGAALLGGLALIPSSVEAQALSVAEPRTITVTPFLSGSFGTSNDLGSSLGAGFGIGYDLTRNLGFEFELGHVFDVAGDDDNLDWSLTNISANAIYHFDRVPRATPYATLGIGWERSNPDFDVPDPLALVVGSTNEIAWNIGAGVKVPVGERLLARGDLRRFQVNDLAPDHWRLYGGLTFWIKR
jgi:opacity protein-like surface antigen